MQLVLEDFVSYDKTSMWRIHDAYYASRGGDAWAIGEIPSIATSSYPMARQQARLLLVLVADLERAKALRPADDVSVLEIGSGSGRFAAMVLRALERGCGEAGRKLLPRIRYMLSDYSRTNLKDALKSPDLAALAEKGLVVPALFDVKKPGELTTLDGKPIQRKFVAAFANYICCATPIKTIKKTPEGFFERRVRLSVNAELEPGETPAQASQRCLKGMIAEATSPLLIDRLALDYDWSPVDLAVAFPDKLHRKALELVMKDFTAATAHYPGVFFDMVRELRERFVPGGMFVVNDFGSSESHDLEGEQDRKPSHYGNTLSLGIDFAVLEGFADAQKFAIVRTHNPLFSVHTAAFRFATSISTEFKKAFDRIHVRGDEGQSLIELSEAANTAAQRNEWATAARLFERCVRLDPTSADYTYKLSRTCLAAGHVRLALKHSKRGQRIDVDKKYDFDFIIGQAYMKTKRPRLALQAFERSLEVDQDAATLANIAKIHEVLGDREKAFHTYRKALDLSKDGPVSAFVVRHLCAEYMPDTPPPRVMERAIPRTI